MTQHVEWIFFITTVLFLFVSFFVFFQFNSNNNRNHSSRFENALVASLDPKAPVAGKLSDFNTSRFAGSDAMKTKTKGVGTPIFMAPEILASEKYDWHADVYSFAVMAWNVWTQKEPYSEGFENQWAILKFVGKGKRLEIPGDVPPELQRVISEGWAQEKTKRPTFSDIVKLLESITL